MASDGVKIIFGAGQLAWPPYTDKEYTKKALDILQAHNVHNLDSAQLYEGSEKMLGELNAGDRFSIDTKWMGEYAPGGATKEYIITSAKKSIETLGVKQVG